MGPNSSYRRHRGLQNAIKRGQDDVELRRRLHALTQQLTRGNTAVVLIDQRRDVPGCTSRRARTSATSLTTASSRSHRVAGELQRVVGALKARRRARNAMARRLERTADGHGGAPCRGRCRPCCKPSPNSRRRQQSVVHSLTTDG
ncbi:hypothetical protein C9J85_00675 [Haloferax sp. wsp5]|nr:hypothetical protein C9J85_00675 [Haloferax sp. wsp5]